MSERAKANDEKQSDFGRIVMLPEGTRIQFLKTLVSAADEDGPGNHYATEGDFGIVAGHGSSEGYWVKWDAWPNVSFGAELGTDFKAVEDADHMLGYCPWCEEVVSENDDCKALPDESGVLHIVCYEQWAMSPQNKAT